jgi:two-component system sensor histidine kinase HydH
MVSRFRLPGRLRWWGCVGGLAVAIGDAVLLSWLGTSFSLGGRDVFWLVAVWFGSSGALLGFLLGDSIEIRGREQTAGRALEAARVRVAQSEKLAALGQLAAAIAHEVRNPLAVVRSAAQGLSETLPAADTDGRRAAAFIIAEVDRLSSVVGALLAYARPLQLQRRPVALGDVVTRAVDLVSGELATRGVVIRREQSPPLPTVQADGDLVCQVLLGLLTNAAEAAPAGGEITVRARTQNGAVEVAVADNGPGIAPELRGRVFEPFFTTRPHGTGLGLAVARQIVEAHGGRIEVSDRPGGGARFTLALPVQAT